MVLIPTAHIDASAFPLCRDLDGLVPCTESYTCPKEFILSEAVAEMEQAKGFNRESLRKRISVYESRPL
jgi:hypothetical protein